MVQSERGIGYENPGIFSDGLTEESIKDHSRRDVEVLSRI